MALSNEDIERELRALDNTLGSASPFGAAGKGKFAFQRPGGSMPTLTDQPARRRPRGDLPPPDPRFTARASSRESRLAGDAEVRRLVGDVAKAEGAESARSGVADGPLARARRRRASQQPKKVAKHVVDHVKKLTEGVAVEAEPPKSMAASAFEFTEEMKQELAERDDSFSFKRDEFRDYVEALAKYRNLSDSKF